MNAPAKIIILIGVVLIVIGLMMLYAGKVPFLGKLPGDIVIRKKNFTFYFPLASGIVLSILATLILYLIGRQR